MGFVTTLVDLLYSRTRSTAQFVDRVCLQFARFHFSFHKSTFNRKDDKADGSFSLLFGHPTMHLLDLWKRNMFDSYYQLLAQISLFPFRFPNLFCPQEDQCKERQNISSCRLNNEPHHQNAPPLAGSSGCIVLGPQHVDLGQQSATAQGKL